MPSIEVRVIDSYIYYYNENSIKFLVLKRNKNRIYEHLWQGVAGKIEKGEKATKYVNCCLLSFIQ